MPRQTEFLVVPTGTEWQITRDGQDFLAVQTKQVAIDEAVHQARRAEPSRVVVLRLDGGVEEEASFGVLAPTNATPPQQYWPAAVDPGRQSPLRPRPGTHRTSTAAG